MTTDAASIDPATTPTLATDAPPAVATLAHHEQVQELTNGDGLTKAQFRVAIEDGFGRGFITRDAANAELKSAGLEPLADPSTTDLAAAEADPLGSLDGGKPTDYRIPTIEGTPAQVVETSKTIGGWLSTAQLPPAIGSYLAKEVASFVAANPDYEARRENEKITHAMTERAKVDRFFGAKDSQSYIDLARQLVDEVEQKAPGVKAILERSGAGNNANVIIQIATHAKRLAARAGSRA